MATRLRKGIQNFLDARIPDSPFLLDIYSTDLETQVMCSTDGEPGEKSGTYEADGEVWGNKRWPYQAGSNPNYNDPDLTFNTDTRVERVGTTWWDFKAKRSVAVGIDIDSVEGHAAGTTAHDSEGIDSLIDRISKLDYVTIVRSTGGKGIHVYVFFDPNNQPVADNHHHHTLHARKVLKLISNDLDYDLTDKVDCVGSVFWIWAKSSPADHPGFSVVKEGNYLDTARLDGIVLDRATIKQGNNNFDAVELDAEHKRLLDAIGEQPYYFNVRADMNVVHAHTCAIRDAIAGGLEIRGSFETVSEGNDPNTANCYLVPLNGGVFRVFRFGNAQQEPAWEWNDKSNFCILNDAPSLQEVIFSNSTKKGNRVIASRSDVAEIARLTGNSCPDDLPDEVELDLSNIGSGRFAVIGKEPFKGAEKSGDKTYRWDVENQENLGSFTDRILRQCDSRLRYVTQGGCTRGWFHKLDSGDWLEYKHYNELAVLVKEYFGKFADKAHSIMMQNPWELVCEPFQAKELDGRRWNMLAPNFAVEPTVSGGDHPHFDMILDHVGQELDEPVQKSEWCRKGNILTGADYLRTWLACLIHHTDQPLPYLFMAGPQNSGKSIFPECCRYLFTGGVASANSALTTNFNAELRGCFLVYVEESDLSDRRHGAYQKIKEWVTGRSLTILEKYQTPVEVPNYLHFVQMANNTTHLPLEDGDTRIVAIDVPALQNPIPKAIMERALAQEAPRFLRTLLDTRIPEPIDRLRIPALTTRTKELMERKAMSPLMAFRKEKVFDVDGQKIKLEKFLDEYASYCTGNGRDPDPLFAVQQEIILRSDRFTTAVRNGTQWLVNVSFDEKAKPGKRITPNKDGRF